MASSNVKIATADRVCTYTTTATESFTSELKISYRLGTTFNDDVTRFDWLCPATGQNSVRVTAPKDNDTASLFPEEWLGNTVDGPISNPSAPQMPEEGGGILEQPIADIYYRIWCVPSFLRLQNPALNTDIPFILWHAYYIDNTLTGIGGSGQTGLTLDLTPPRPFFPAEDITVNLQIGPAAPNQVFAIFLFNFTEGQGEFTFETTLLDWIKFIPEEPVVEVWTWLTDLIIAHNGSNEQRISVRAQPRRRVEAGLLLEDDVERQREYDRLYNRIGRDLVIPYYQYSTRLTAGAAITDTKIYFDPSKTDFRDDELAVIYRPTTDESFIVQLGTIESDGAQTAAPLTVELQKYDIIAPGFVSRINNRTAISMTTVAGMLKFQAISEDFRSTFNRVGTPPVGSAAVIDTYDGLNVLDRCPMVTGQVPETFDQDPHIHDNETGIHDQATSWLHPFIDGMRKWNIKRITDPNEMDYWRDFITEARGMREPFLMPSWREDLFLATTPNPADPKIEVDSLSYSSQYFPYDTYKRLRLVNPDGDSIYRKVTAVEDQPGGTVLLTLNDPLPNDPAWGNGFEIQYLNKVRFGSDQVKLTHFTVNTILEASIRTTDT